MAETNTSQGQLPEQPPAPNAGKNTKKNKAKKAKAKAKKAQLQLDTQQSPVDDTFLVPEPPVAQTDRRNSLLSADNHVPLSSNSEDSKAIGDVISSIAQESALTTEGIVRRSLIAEAEVIVRKSLIAEADSTLKVAADNKEPEIEIPLVAVDHVSKKESDIHPLEPEIEPVSKKEPEIDTSEIEAKSVASVETKVDDPKTLVAELPASKLKEWIPEEKAAEVEFEPTIEQLTEEPSITTPAAEPLKEQQQQLEPTSAASKEADENQVEKDERSSDPPAESTDPIPWENVTKVPTLIDHPSIPVEEEEEIAPQPEEDVEEETQVEAPIVEVSPKTANVDGADVTELDELSDSQEPHHSSKLPWDSEDGSKQEEALPWETDSKVVPSPEAKEETEQPVVEQSTLKTENNVVQQQTFETDGFEEPESQGSKLPWDTNGPSTAEVSLPWDSKGEENAHEPLPWDSKETEREGEVLPWDSKETGNVEEALPWDSKETENVEEALPWEQNGAKEVENPTWEAKEIENGHNVQIDSPGEVDDINISTIRHPAENIQAKHEDDESRTDASNAPQITQEEVTAPSVAGVTNVTNAPSENPSNSKLDSIFNEIDDEELDDGFFLKLEQVKKEKDSGVNENAEKALSLSFLDDDDLLFEEEVKAPQAQNAQPIFETKQTPAPVRQNSYIPVGTSSSNRGPQVSFPGQQTHATSNFVAELEQVKRKNDAYDFPMPINSDKVRPAPRRQQSSKYGPSSSTSVHSANQGPPRQQGSNNSLGANPTTGSPSPNVPPQGPAKSFFEELPISMPKPAPRPPRVPKATASSIKSPAHLHVSADFHGSASPNANIPAQMNVKPNPYAPKPGNAPPTPANVRTGVVPPPLPPSGMNQGIQNFGGNNPPQAIPPPTILQPGQITGQISPYQQTEHFPSVNQQQHNMPHQFGNANRKLSNPPPPNTINTNVNKVPSSGSATSPYVPNAGPYAPNGHRRTHSRASSLVGGKGKEVNPYAPALPIVNQANGAPQVINGSNNLLPATGVIPPTNPIGSPHVGPIPKSNLLPMGMAPQQLHQQQQFPQRFPQQFQQLQPAHIQVPQQQYQLHPPSAGGNRARGLSNPKSSVYSRNQPQLQDLPAPKVQNPQTLLSRQFPIFSWSNSGNVAYLIPKRATSTYGNSLSEDINISSVTKLLKSNEILASFPGPLGKSSSKSKKKELEKWLEDNILRMSNSTASVTSSNEIVLNQVLLALIQTNGDSRSKHFAEIVCPLLSPQIDFKSDSQPMEMSSNSGISLGAPTGYKLDNTGLNVVLGFLQVGKIEEGISFCISKGDWTMALMIANSVGQEKFQKIASDYARMTFPFQKSQSKVHHLMPILLKAINGAASSVIQEFLSVPSEAEWALQHWRDIVSLVLINGGQNSVDFCINFGKYLSGCPGFGIVSDICFILGGAVLSPVVSPVNGVLFSIVGTETASTSIYSEIFDFALQLNPLILQGVPPSGLPHLIPLKLRHALLLADYGLFVEAQKYCDFLGPTLKTSSSSASNSNLIWREFQQLAMRLSSTNYQDSSWFGNKISKVNLDKMWGHLDKFIGGEEPKSKGENGVFSKFSPSVSRNASTLDFTALNSNNVITSINNTIGNNHNVPPNGRPTYPDNVASFSSAPATSSDNATFGYNSLRANELYDGRVTQVPPPLVRNNTTGSSKYAPLSVQQPQLSSHLTEEYPAPPPPLHLHTLETSSRYAPSNMSSLSLHLNNLHSDIQSKKFQRERQPLQPAQDIPEASRPFPYMNPASQYSNLSNNVSRRESIEPNTTSGGDFKPFKSDLYQQSSHPPSTQPQSHVSSEPGPSEHYQQPPPPQQPQQRPQQEDDRLGSLLQSTPKAFHRSMEKRRSVESITTENFGNPDSLRDHTHSPSAQSDISMDYPSEFKPTTRKFEFGSMSYAAESPEKKREASAPIVTSPDLKKSKPDLKQVDLQAVPPPPVKPPSSQRERVNPYAPGGNSKPVSRKSKYGPPPGSSPNESQFVPPPALQADMYSFGGYHTTTKEDIERSQAEDKESSNEPKSEIEKPSTAQGQRQAEDAPVRISVPSQSNVDVSFDGSIDAGNDKLRIPDSSKPPVKDALGGFSPPVKNQPILNSFQNEIDNSPRVGNFNNFAEFPVPGTPDYTTRANSVLGGNDGYFSSRLSQSHQSAMYQQYEVEDDTVQEYIPVVEEEEEEEDDYLVEKEKKLRLKQLEEEAKAKAQAAEEEKKRREAEEKQRMKEKESKKQSEQSSGNGWFGSWLGGKDDGKPKPIRAKLGEKNKFYYDEKLKKWINKDLPLEDQIKPSGPPPPPKMKMANPPTGSSSPGQGPAPPGPSGPPGKPLHIGGSDSDQGPPGASGPKLGGPQLGGSTPSISSAGSRTPSLATAGLDDLLSIGTPPVGGAARKGKRGPKRGYVNVLNLDK